MPIKTPPFVKVILFVSRSILLRFRIHRLPAGFMITLQITSVWRPTDKRPKVINLGQRWDGSLMALQSAIAIFFLCYAVCQSLSDFDGIYPYGLLTGVMIISLYR